MADLNNISVDSIYRTAEAERGKFWVVDEDYLSTLNYPTSGRGKYAVLTYQVNSAPVTISGDVTMGAVELKDETSEDRVNVALDDTKNAMYVQSESLASETTLLGLSGIVDGVTQTPDLIAAPNIIQMGGISETTVPSGVDDGDAVAVWYDEFGRQVIAGYNPTEGALNVKVINEALLNRAGPIELHTGASGSDSSETHNVNGFNNVKIHVYVAGSATFDFTIKHQISSATDWYSIYSETVTMSAETMEISLSDEVWNTIQTEITNHTGGGVNAAMIAGN